MAFAQELSHLGASLQEFIGRAGKIWDCCWRGRNPRRGMGQGVSEFGKFPTLCPEPEKDRHHPGGDSQPGHDFPKPFSVLHEPRDAASGHGSSGSNR